MQIEDTEFILFSCRPHCKEGKAGEEKKALEPFIAHFNNVVGTSYVPEIWFDEEKASGPKKPEVLLKDANGKLMVVERTSIRFPQECSQVAGEFYALSKLLRNRLNASFSSGLYVLTLNDDVKKVNSRRRAGVADAIVKSVQARREAIMRGRIIGGKDPIHWRFEQAPEHVREDYALDEVGVRMYREAECLAPDQMEYIKTSAKAFTKKLASRCRTTMDSGSCCWSSMETEVMTCRMRSPWTF